MGRIYKGVLKHENNALTQTFVYRMLRHYIVFIWSQYDGGNIDKEQWLKFPPKPNEAKLNYGRRLILDPNIQHLDPIIHCISTSERVIHMMFAGRNHPFQRLNNFSHLFSSQTEKAFRCYS